MCDVVVGGDQCCDGREERKECGEISPVHKDIADLEGGDIVEALGRRDRECVEAIAAYSQGFEFRKRRANKGYILELFESIP